MIRRLGLALLLVCSGAAAGDGAVERLRSWAQRALAQELARSDPDLNMVASLVNPLVTDARLHGDGTSRRSLQLIASRVASLSAGKLDCTGLSDLFLIEGLLHEAGILPAISLDPAVLRDCLDDSTLFDLANALIFTCGYSGWAHEHILPRGLERLEAAQRTDGAFVAESGRPWFYLTTHAMLAVYLCGGDRAVFARACQRLEGGLGRLLRNGMWDGLAEALVFLRLTGRRAQDEAFFFRWLEAQVGTDGGVCFRLAPGCSPHWHPASLIFQLALERKRDGTAADPG